MDDEQFCNEVKKVLKEIGPDKDFFKKIMDLQQSEMEFNAWRYKNPRAEHAYENLAKFKKINNLISHLLNLNN